MAAQSCGSLELPTSTYDSQSKMGIAQKYLASQVVVHRAAEQHNPWCTDLDGKAKGEQWHGNQRLAEAEDGANQRGENTASNTHKLAPSNYAGRGPCLIVWAAGSHVLWAEEALR